MINWKQIPPEVHEAFTQAFVIDAHPFNLAFSIALSAWPGAFPQTYHDDKSVALILPLPQEAMKGEQRTICEACGNSNLAHDRAVWTDDGTSYCPSCRPLPQEARDGV